MFFQIVQNLGYIFFRVLIQPSVELFCGKTFHFFRSIHAQRSFLQFDGFIMKKMHSKFDWQKQQFLRFRRNRLFSANPDLPEAVPILCVISAFLFLPLYIFLHLLFWTINILDILRLLTSFRGFFHKQKNFVPKFFLCFPSRQAKIRIHRRG